MALASLLQGNLDYKAFIRALEPLVCAQGALARYFWWRFVYLKEPFPDPAFFEIWLVFYSLSPDSSAVFSW
jgi:hypothetical protein